MTQIKSLVDAIDSFIKGTKADGDWDAIKASCIMAGWDGLAGCLTPLKGTAPTNNGPFVSGDYNRITGLKGNGSTKRLNSNRNNNADPRNDQHMSVYATEVLNGGWVGCGVAEEGVSALMPLTTYRARHRNNTLTTTSVSIANGFAGLSRNASGSYVIRGGSTNTTASVASQAPANMSILVFSRGTTSSPQDLTLSRLSFYSIGESLNLANLDTRVSTLMTAIGAAFGPYAIGGEVTLATIDDVDYKIHTFTTSADFVVSGGTLAGVEWLRVAGGSGAGSRTGGGGGGGGAGGMQTGSQSVAAGTYAIAIGAGGPGSSSDVAEAGSNGSDTTGLGGTTLGGGGGGGGVSTSGKNGGSGGGQHTISAGLVGTAGTGTSGQGNDGGNAFHLNTNSRASGGGGGAGGVGGNAPNAITGGVGGVGSASSISGSSVTYATGGKGSAFTASEDTVDAAANSGNGGAATNSDDFRRGGNGGSGIIIIRYPI